MSDDLGTVWQISKAMTAMSVTPALWEPWVKAFLAKDDEITRLRAENKRLRDGHLLYVAECDWQSPPPSCSRPAHMCCKISRAALGDDKGETDA